MRRFERPLTLRREVFRRDPSPWTETTGRAVMPAIVRRGSPTLVGALAARFGAGVLRVGRQEKRQSPAGREGDGSSMETPRHRLPPVYRDHSA